MWFDPWLNGTSLIDKFGWNCMVINGGCNKKVTSLLSCDKWKHNLSKIPAQIHHYIHNISIPDQKHQDF